MATPIGILSGKILTWYNGKSKKELGKGSGGTVEEYVTPTGPVAVKVFSFVPAEEDYGNSGEDGSISQQGLFDIVYTIHLDHPNVIKLLDIAWIDFGMITVLPLAESSLDVAIRTKLSPEDIKMISLQILRGANYIQSKGILHADYKPGNILITHCDDIIKAKIIDFGIARNNYCFNADSRVAFSIPYRAPEILLGAPYEEPADVWALGLTILEMYNVRLIFPGDSDIDELYRIFRFFGTPNETTWPGISKLPDYKATFPSWKPVAVGFAAFLSNVQEEQRAAIIAFVSKMVVMDPSKRATLTSLISDPFFDDARDILQLPCLKAPSVEPFVCKSYLLQHQAPTINIAPSTDITSMRSAVSMIFFVSKGYGRLDRTIILAIHLARQYNSIKQPTNPNVHISYLVSLVIASKVVESSPPGIGEYTRMTTPKYMDAQLIEMERDILTTLVFDVNPITAYDILNAMGASFTLETRNIALSLLLLCQGLSSNPISEQDLVLSVIALACNITGDKVETKPTKEIFIPFIHILRAEAKDILTAVEPKAFNRGKMSIQKILESISILKDVV